MNLAPAGPILEHVVDDDQVSDGLGVGWIRRQREPCAAGERECNGHHSQVGALHFEPLVIFDLTGVPYQRAFEGSSAGLM